MQCTTPAVLLRSCEIQPQIGASSLLKLRADNVYTDICTFMYMYMLWYVEHAWEHVVWMNGMPSAGVRRCSGPHYMYFAFTT